MTNRRSKSLPTSYLLGLALVFAVVPTSWAYDVNCDVNSSNIASVLGETRPSSQYPPGRLHTGVDLAGCDDGEPINAVNGGSVSYTPECGIGDNSCRRVTAEDGSVFDYIHLRSAVAVGGNIAQGAQLGIVDGDHLHLAQVQRAGTFAINPQFPGQLTFNRSADSQPTFMNLTVAGVIDSVIPVHAFDQDIFPNQTATPFIKASNGVYYLRGDADVLVTVNAQPFFVPDDRKGVFMVGILILQAGSVNRLFDGRANIPFQTIVDQLPNNQGFRTIYYSTQTDSRTYWATNLKINNVLGMQARNSQWSSSTAPEGAIKLCGVVKNFPGANELWDCKDGVIDRTVPSVAFSAGGTPFTSATTTPTVTIEGTDTGSGVYTITLSSSGWSQTSTNSAVSTAYSETFPIGGGNLLDGLYSVSVQDLSGNISNSAFSIDSTSPNADIQSANGSVLGSTVTSMKCVVLKGTSTLAGIDSITISGPGGFGSYTYPLRCSKNAKSGSYCQIPTGNYTLTVTNCAGKSSTRNFYYDNTSATNYIFEAYSVAFGTLSTSGTFSIGKLRNDPMSIQGSAPAGTLCSQISPSQGSCASTINGPVSGYTITPSASSNLSVSNSTTSSVTTGIDATLWVDYGSIFGESAILNFPYDATTPFSPGTYISMTATIAEVGQIYPKSSATVSGSPPFSAPMFTSPSATCYAYLEVAFHESLGGTLGACAEYSASDFIFVSSAPIQFQFTDTTVDTNTLRIYGWTGVSWSSGAVANQSASRNGSGVVTVSGETRYSGFYAAFYQANDSSAPVTTFTIQGSSFNFEGALFVSTDAYAVLIATDPSVNGFASTVASSTYRLNPSSGSPFVIYTSSIPLTLGTHVFEYASIDYAGNAEAIRTTTFTVTAGTAFRTSSTAKIPGNLLVGFLGSSAKAEVVSAAQNPYTLLISSANRQPLDYVSNIGAVGLGVTPQATLAVGQNAIGLQLRSGNSTSSVTSNQIAFGYNGDYALRHLLRTEHSTSTDGNRMDFLVWNPGAGSTTTLASLKVLSLQGITAASNGSFHVHPFGEPDVEAEISDGLTTGGGTMQRLQVVMPSSRRFKTDIVELDERDEERALDDIASLKHARFRYKGSNEIRTGLIYEEVPASIRDGQDAVSLTERMVNIELALKAEMRKLEALQKRYEALKAKRRIP